MDSEEKLKIYEKVVEELWDSGKIPHDEMMTINKILRGEVKFDFECRWNVNYLTYTKEYYENKVKEFSNK